MCDNESFVALVPFWANWPFETLVLCKRQIRHIDEMTDRERDDLADILKRLTTRYDNLFEAAFPIQPVCIKRPPMVRSTQNGTGTCISIRHSCDLRQ